MTATMHTSVGSDALAALHQARRRRRAADVDVFEAVYRAYLTAIVLGIGVLLLSGLTGDARLSQSAVDRVRRDGPAVVGLVAAVVTAIGLRSGGRGGPLVIEAADVRHVLLSPVDRSAALRGPAIRQLRFAAFAGLVAGSIAGLLAFRRLPGTPGFWVLCGAAAGALAAMLAVGAGTVMSGLRLGRILANLLALAVVAWSVADLVTHHATSPLTLLGRLAVWPLHVDPLALVGVAVPLVAAAVGLAVVGGTSLEAAERRASLAGQMRFAATLQDIRTVIVLRRQLAQERPRNRPWIRLPARPEPRWPVWRRGWHGILRWPLSRVIRLTVLAVVAGLCVAEAWRNTTPLIVLAGLALFVAGLDAVEPLAQDVDHPDRTASYPVDLGDLQLRQIAPSVLVMVGVCATAALAALVASRDPATVLPVAAIVIVPAAVLAVVGAAMSVVKGPPDVGGSTSVFLPPEAAGMRLVMRLIWPPTLVVIGLLPLFAGRAADRAGEPVAPGTVAAEVGVVAVAAIAVLWVRYRERVHAAIEESTGGAFGG